MKTIRLHPKAAEGSAEGMLNIGQKIKFYFGSLFYGEQVGHVAKDGTCLFRKAGKKQISNVEGTITETFDTVVDLNGPILRPVKRGCMRKTPISVDRNGTGVYAVDRKLEVRGENGWEVAKSKPQKPEIEPQELAQSCFQAAPKQSSGSFPEIAHHQHWITTSYIIEGVFCQWLAVEIDRIAIPSRSLFRN